MKKIVSIDVSSKTLDICIKEDGSKRFEKIDNTVKSIKSFFKSLNQPETIVAMENTGRYNWSLYEVLANFKGKIYVISPIHLKKSMGLVRGKNDKIDAERIGLFIEKNEADLVPWKQAPQGLRKLKVLLTERLSRIKMKRQLSIQKHDYKLMKTIGLDKKLSKLNAQLIENIEQQLKEIESNIEALIQEDVAMKDQANLIKSVPGVGKVLCWTLLAKTEGFTLINDPRKMACYSGVVPFDHQSGTSIKWKPKVSVFADKTLKSILHLAAMSAIRLNNDLATYYKRKVAEGKNKMSVLNAIRNKIIHRVFAVIKNQKKYNFDLVLS